MTLESLKLHPGIMAGFRALRLTGPSPFIENTAPLIIQGLDVIGLAPIGTVRTASYAMPVIQRLCAGSHGYTRALVLSLSNETAKETVAVFDTLTSKTNLETCVIHSGLSLNKQVRELRNGADIIIACTRRLLDHLWKGTITLTELETIVIDDADQFFQEGLLTDIQNILACIQHQSQILMFARNIPSGLLRFIGGVMHNPVTVPFDQESMVKTVEPIALSSKRIPVTTLLRKILSGTKADTLLVFTHPGTNAKCIAEQLTTAGFKVFSLMGKLSGKQSQVMAGLKGDSIVIMVVVDAAGTGIAVSRIHRIIGTLTQNGKPGFFVMKPKAESLQILDTLFTAPLTMM